MNLYLGNTGIFTTGNAVAQPLQNEGAEIIIALTCQNKEEDITLAKEVPGINLIIGSHDHLIWNSAVTGPEGRIHLIG